MRRLPGLFLLLLTFSTLCISQSGRRITTTTTPIAPIQPPLHPELEAPAAKPEPRTLLFLPETLVERRLRSLDDNSFRLADFQGRVLVINIWASWCGPCRAEISEYEKVRKEYLGRNVEFIGFTTEDPALSRERVNKFVRDTGFNFILGWADRETARILMSGEHGIPQTLVIDSEGKVISHWVGYARGQSGDQLRDAINNALR